MSGRAANRPVATRIFLVWLLLSIGASATVGWFEPGDAPRALSAAGHALFPISLAAAKLLIVKVPSTGHVRVDCGRIGLAVLIAVVAFVGSAENLHVLGLFIGFSSAMAWMLPVIIDLTMGVAMVTDVALATRPKPQPSNTTNGVAKPATTAKRGSVKKAAPAGVDVAALAAANPGWTRKQLAEKAGVSERTVRRRLAVVVTA